MTLDDFEWVEEGFDRHVLTHKTIEMAIASVSHYNGWRVSVWKATRDGSAIAEDGLDLDAGKAIAMLYANQHMKEYEDVVRKTNGFKRRRVKTYRPEEVPAGVFKMDRVRR